MRGQMMILFLTLPGASHHMEVILNIRHGVLELGGVGYLVCQNISACCSFEYIVMEYHTLPIALESIYWHITRWPGQGFQPGDGQRLNDILNDTVLTYQYTGDIEDACIEVWGAARKVVRRGKHSKSRYTMCGLWVRLHAPARSMRYMCNVCT